MDGDVVQVMVKCVVVMDGLIGGECQDLGDKFEVKILFLVSSEIFYGPGR